MAQMKQALASINELVDRNIAQCWFIDISFNNVTVCILLMILMLHTTEIQATFVMMRLFQKVFYRKNDIERAVPHHSAADHMIGASMFTLIYTASCVLLFRFYFFFFFYWCRWYI